MLKKLLEHVRWAEGFVPHCYDDPRGFRTIGIGRMVDERLGGGITEAEAEFLLHNDLIKLFADLDLRLPWWRQLDEVRALVIADMCFNLGVAKLLKFKRTLAAVQAGDWAMAAKGMRKSAWYGQVGRRSKKLVRMMESGVDPGGS